MIDGFSIPTAIHLLLVNGAVTLAICFLVTLSVSWKSFPVEGRFVPTITGLSALMAPILFIGSIVGFMMSSSRAPAIGDVMPAVLSIVGGMTIAVYSLESVRKSMIAGLACAVFALTLMVGSAYGSFIRETSKLERMLYLSEQEVRIRNYRKNRGLPEEIPDWILEQ